MLKKGIDENSVIFLEVLSHMIALFERPWNGSCHCNGEKYDIWLSLHAALYPLDPSGYKSSPYEPWNLLST